MDTTSLKRGNNKDKEVKGATISLHLSKTLPLYAISRAEEPGLQSEKLISGYMLCKLTRPELLVPHNLHTLHILLDLIRQEIWGYSTTEEPF